MTTQIVAVAYSDPRATEWDAFVRRARAPFMFERAYLDYHRDRFQDASLLLYQRDRLIALFPAMAQGDTVCSHRGLTYGGLVHERETLAKILAVFDMLSEYYARTGFAFCEYKPVPYIYGDYPGQEDLYALFRLGATLEGRAISATVPLATRLPLSESRKSGLRKSSRAAVQVRESDDFATFWAMLEATLSERHGVEPVHTLSEIELLHSRFPGRIRLFLAYDLDVPGAGCVIYEVGPVAHVQYIGSTAQGRQWGLVDALFNEIIGRYASDKKWLDFGTSNEQGGHVLNENLAFQKEGFGGRGVVYDTYRYQLSRRIF